MSPLLFGFGNVNSFFIKVWGQICSSFLIFVPIHIHYLNKFTQLNVFRSLGPLLFSVLDLNATFPADFISYSNYLTTFYSLLVNPIINVCVFQTVFIILKQNLCIACKCHCLLYYLGNKWEIGIFFSSTILKLLTLQMVELYS